MDRTGQRPDPTDRLRPALQPLLPVQSASLPLRACLLSGGASRRMGRDKALLPHPEGGSWLERTLWLLLALEIPVTLFSRHERHLQQARELNRTQGDDCAMGPPTGPSDACGGSAVLPGRATAATSHPDSGAAAGTPRLTALAEAPPWEGPLLALQRLMERHPDQRLLLCPVDMPGLRLEELRQLVAAAGREPGRIHLAHDGRRLQPLLGIYPSTAVIRAGLTEAVQGGERRLQGWLATQPIQAIRLDPHAIRNVNHPQDGSSTTSTAGNGLPGTGTGQSPTSPT